LPEYPASVPVVAWVLVQELELELVQELELELELELVPALAQV
jgi:hypothetical protein